MVHASAAERVFRLVDLTDLICENAAVRSPDGKLLDASLLVALARLNSSISVAALRQLWRHVHSYQIIVDLVPSLNPFNRGHIRDKFLENCQYWRALFYTNLIYSLRPLDSGDNVFGLDALYFNIKRRWPQEPIYKNLRDLELTRDFGPGSRLLETIDLTQLRHISLPITAKIIPLLSSIFDRVTRLESLEITTTACGPWVTCGVTLIKSLITVKKLKLRICSDVLIDMLHYFPYFPGLTSLELVCDLLEENTLGARYAFPKGNVPKWPTGRSWQLSLRATDVNMALIPTILEKGTPKYLLYTSLELHFTTTVNDSARTLTKAIRSISLECPMLTSLTILQQPPTSHSADKAHLAKGLLEPLLVLRHLRVIHIVLEKGLLITQSLLSDFSVQFSQLEHCVFGPSDIENEKDGSGIEGDTLISIIDMARFASRCRHLRTLGMTAHRVKKCFDGAWTMDHVSRSLVSLDVGCTPVENTRETIGFIRHAFPFLDRLTWEDRGENRREHISAWSAIHSILFS